MTNRWDSIIGQLLADHRFYDAQQVFDREFLDWEERWKCYVRHVGLCWTTKEEQARYAKERQERTRAE